MSDTLRQPTQGALTPDSASVSTSEAYRQWASRPEDERYSDLESLFDACASRRTRSREVHVETDKLQVKQHEATGELVINGETSESKWTHWSFGQTCNLVGAPAKYLRDLPDVLIRANLTYGLATQRETMKFMTVQPDNDTEQLSTLQAVTSTTYGRIWDADCVKACQHIVERSNGRFHNPLAYAAGDYMGHKGTEPRPSGLYASDRDVFMFMIDGGSLLEAGPRAKLNRGFFMWNSEVGSRSFGLMTFLFNQVCGNHLIWGAQDVNKIIIRHSSGGPYRFETEGTPALKQFVEAPAAPIEEVLRKAQDYMLPVRMDGDEEKSMREFVAKRAKFSAAEVRDAMKFARAEEGECRTLWQLVQGFTASARAIPHMDTRIDLEKRAGKLMSFAE